MHISISSVIIDDIVLPDGTTYMACLGGGGIHAVMGMRVWSETVGLVANIGYDFPGEIKANLEGIFDVQGLILKNMKTVRAWQLFNNAGKRTEVLRSQEHSFDQLKVDIKNFPAVYSDLRGVHLHVEITDLPLWVSFLRRKGNPFILWEPLQKDCIPENGKRLVDVLPLVDCVSPNLEEARLLLGIQDTERLMAKYLDYGAKRVVIREGAVGSTYADTENHFIKVPVVKVDQVIDQTGAGNAYCGGFVVGFSDLTGVEDALCKAAVSASFALEQFGALFSIERARAYAWTRYNACKQEMDD